MDPIIEVILQYGVIGIVLGWFMWRDITVVKELQKTLQDFTKVMARLDYALVDRCENDVNDQ